MQEPVSVAPTPARPSGDTEYPRPRYAWYVLGVLTLVYVFSFLDRQILNLLVAPIRRDLHISDTQMSLMIGFTFALFYVAFGIPLGRVADSMSRTRLGNGQALALSIDGSWAATVATRAAPSPIVLMPTGAGEARTLKGGDLICLEARFFADGKRLLVRASEPGHNPRLYVQGIDDAKARPLSPEGTFGLAISPDGTRAATLAPDGHAVSYPTEGGDALPLKGFEAGDEPIQWGADGKSLFAVHSADRGLDVYRITLESGKRELWRSFGSSDPQNTVARVLITPDGRSTVVVSTRVWHELDVVSGVH